MFLRILLSCLLAVFGIASPWLVRDWLAWQSSNRSRPLATVPVIVPRQPIQNSSGNLADHTDAGSQSDQRAQNTIANSPFDSSDSTGLTRVSYPVVSTAIRFFQGLAPRPFSAISSQGIPFLSGTAIPTSPRAMAAVTRARSKLDGPLQSLGLRLGNPIFLRIFKEEKELELWVKGGRNEQFELFRIYKIEDWSGGLGPKLREGDGQTPEGFYYVPASRLRPDTRYHLGMDLGYPNAYDRSHHRSGSEITIHGKGSALGSFALSDSGMEEVYTMAEAALKGGQKFFRVNVFPFRMSDERMDRVWKAQPRWVAFWVNLKEGYDFFENAGFPPNVGVRGGSYVFSAK